MATINMYHLRRIFVPEGEESLVLGSSSNGEPGLNGTHPSIKDLNGTEKLENIPKEKLAEFRSKCTVILLDELTKIGRNPELVDVVLNSKTHSNMISRNHSEIHGIRDENGKYVRYYIVDRSLNGTYINETRALGEVKLNEGDIIKFGHVNGAAIKAGNFAPQQYAEFVFRFERAFPNHKYMGFTADGQRIKTVNRGAYMQINSESQKPRPCPPLIPTATSGLPQPVPSTTTAQPQSAVVPNTAGLQQATKVPSLEELLHASNSASTSAHLAQLAQASAAAGQTADLSQWSALNAAMRLQQQRYYNPAALAAAYLQNPQYAAFWPNAAAWRTSLTGTTQDPWNQFNSASLANPSALQQLRVPGLAYPQAIGGQQSTSTNNISTPSSSTSVFSSTGAFSANANSSLATSNSSTAANPFSSLASPGDIAARLEAARRSMGVGVTSAQQLTPQAQQLAAQIAAAQLLQHQQQAQAQQQQQQNAVAAQQRLHASNSYIPNSGSGQATLGATLGQQNLPLAAALAAAVATTQNSINLTNSKTPTSGHFVFDAKPATSSAIQSSFQKPKDPPPSSIINPQPLSMPLKLDTHTNHNNTNHASVRADISTLAAAATLCANASPTISPRLKQVSPLVTNISAIKKVEDSRRSSASSIDEKAVAAAKKEETESIPSDPSTSTAGSEADKASVKKMECDSSVPSPPKNQHNIADTIISAANSPNHIPSSPPRAPRPSCRSDSQSPPPITSAVERSDESENESRSSSRSENRRKSPENRKKSPDDEKKKPALVGRTPSVSKKISRKSNEVEQLLKDLCDGNNMWSHMRRMELKKPSEKEQDKKKTLRLEERQKKIIEKKKGHKMLKQISDESSDGESDNESAKKKQWSDDDSDDEREVPKKEEPKKRTSSTASKGRTRSKDTSKEAKTRASLDTNSEKTPSTGSSLLAKALNSSSKNTTQQRRRKSTMDKEDKKVKTTPKTVKKPVADKNKSAKKAVKRGRKNSMNSSDDEDVLKERPFSKGKSTNADSDDSDADEEPQAKRFSTGSSFLSKDKDDEPAIPATTDIWETCAFRNCKRPQAESLNWVQCDDCCAWYHTYCILGKEIEFAEDESFTCGCKIVTKLVPATKNKRKAKAAA